MISNIVGSVARGKDCFGREELVEVIWEKLITGHVLLAAPRRFGKTSIMYQIIDNPRPGFKIVHLDLEHMIEPNELLTELILQLIKDSKLAAFLKTLSILPATIWTKISKNIEEIELFEIKLTIKQSLKQSWKEIGKELFDRIAQSPDSVIFILDEFPMMIDRMTRTNGCREDARTLLRWLRMLRQKTELNKLHFLIAGSIGIDNVLNELGEIASINDFERVKVGPFSQKTAVMLIDELAVRYKLPLTPKCKTKITGLIGTPIPYFLQIIFSEIHKAYRIDGDQITQKKIEQIYSNKILGVDCKSYFDHYYGRLRDYYRKHEEKAAKRILRTLATERALKLDTCFQIYKKEAGDQATHDEFSRLMTNLENDYYIALNAETSMYEFACKLLRDWWLRHYAMETEC